MRYRRIVPHLAIGVADGIIGSKTRTAVKAMQIKFKMPADSYPTTELIAKLRGG